MQYTLKDIYDTVNDLEQSLRDIDVDIFNIDCGDPACLLGKEQKQLLSFYQSMMQTDVDFCNLDMLNVLNRINHCFDCIQIDTGILTGGAVTPPSPVNTVNVCSGTRSISLNDVKRFRVYEGNGNSVDVYIVSTTGMPDIILPPNSQKKYTVTWNSASNALSIRYTNVDGVSAPPMGGCNIAGIVAEFTDLAALHYGRTETQACQVSQLTPNVQWYYGLGIEQTVDTSLYTYPHLVSANSTEVVLEFQFKA